MKEAETEWCSLKTGKQAQCIKMLRESFKKRFPGGGGDLPVHLVALLGEIDPRLMMVEKYMFVALRQ